MTDWTSLARRRKQALISMKDYYLTYSTHSDTLSYRVVKYFFLSRQLLFFLLCACSAQLHCGGKKIAYFYNWWWVSDWNGWKSLRWLKEDGYASRSLYVVRENKWLNTSTQNPFHCCCKQVFPLGWASCLLCADNRRTLWFYHLQIIW